MKFGALRCPACGRVRYVSARELGATVACNACAGTIEVPGTLSIADYSDVLHDRVLARRTETTAIVAFFFACLPAAAAAWWFADGVIGRRRDEGRPVDPMLLRARRTAAIVALLQALGALAVVAYDL